MTETPPNRTPAIIGFLIAGAVILGASFFVSTLGGDVAYDDVPPVVILDPASGDSVSNPVTITFSTPGELRLDPAMGWSAGELHLHVMAGDQELMPAAADIAPLDSVWTWRLPTLGSGPQRLYLTWAGRHHGNLRGQTDTVLIHVRDAGE
ncbi:MAG: hypothetical protein KFH98_03160 [Gemmatimonadetes bacterium]|nr:hypothetical protein [Gemmatimonadota bacterium]